MRIEIFRFVRGPLISKTEGQDKMEIKQEHYQLNFCKAVIKFEVIYTT